MRLRFLAGVVALLAVIAISGCISCDFSSQGEVAVKPWEKYKDAAKEAKKNQRYELAEKNYLQSIDEITKKYSIDASMKTNSIAYYIDRDYEELSRIHVIQGRYNDAIEEENKYYQLRKDVLELHQIFWHYGFLEEIYQAQGKFEDAQKAVDWLVQNGDQGVREAEEGLKKIKGEIHGYDRVDLINANGRKYTNAYPTIANYYIAIGDYEKAIQYMRELVDYAVKGNAPSHNMATVKNQLASAYYYAGDDALAEKFFRDAAGLNAHALVGFPVDLCNSLTMLGKIAEHRGQSGEALKFYQTAIQSLHMYKTLVYKVEESDVWNQIGRFQLKQNNPAESAKAYNEAIRLRQVTGTATHPNCADAHKGLADVAAFKNELTSATLEAAQALKILDTALVPTHPRIAPTLIALSSIDILAGHPEQAAPLLARIETIRQKPLGPWKEDFMDTAAFYAGLLKKAGKTEASARLDQFAACQKALR